MDNLYGTMIHSFMIRVATAYWATEIYNDKEMVRTIFHMS